tara:strand:+ start:834 stop:974 length:141 start_codon:yes stop_codon:yes gene_type:complete
MVWKPKPCILRGLFDVRGVVAKPEGGQREHFLGKAAHHGTVRQRRI